MLYNKELKQNKTKSSIPLKTKAFNRACGGNVMLCGKLTTAEIHYGVRDAGDEFAFHYHNSILRQVKYGQNRTQEEGNG